MLAAIAAVPRELFVPEELKRRAYDDRALPIGHGQTISQPFMVATICAALELGPEARVLDVGTGSGYQAAVLAELAAEVVTIERVPELAERARETLARAGYDRRRGPGRRRHARRAGACALRRDRGRGRRPRRPGHALRPARRRRPVVVPVGSLHDQWLEVVVRRADGPEVARSVPCRFVPLVGAAGFDEPSSCRGSARVGASMQRSSALRASGVLARTRVALGRPQNWLQLGRFCAVGASGYVVNLVVYTLLLHGADLHYLLAASGSFLVAVTNNYTWNRLWTFRRQRGHVGYQGLRFLVVSTCALGANLVVLYVLVRLGVGKVPAQAIAIVLVTPLNFVGNKLWSFGR